MRINQDPDRWARLRFSIIGPLLSAPPKRGQLHKKLQELSRCRWKHPLNGADVRFSTATLERWFYAARQAQDPVAALRRCRRSDAGRARIAAETAPTASPVSRDELPALLRKLMADYAATGMPPAYLPKPPSESES